eukprot:TRINITY_DN9202_c0_g1_i3.p3 TRINITY_DN9202_c0_g1~~TRINITY_DN9202_c0_g1_i3.p3  ORF type:complete len:167 (+),score=39.71 TRINITY_DN9202_c0_g1_i3:379-879(+)
MGDKPYKNVEYCGDFYNGGGLIPGSNIAERKKKPMDVGVARHVKFPLSKGRTLWKDRERNETENEDLKSVVNVHSWENTTLKEANPKWRDPDTIELPDRAVDDKKSGAAKDDPKNKGKKKQSNVFYEQFISFAKEIRYYDGMYIGCLLYTSPSPRDGLLSRMPSSA